MHRYRRFNTKGNIRSVHWYHRQRVSAENILPFGRAVGAGMIIIGASIVQFGIMSIVSEALKHAIFALIGSIILVIGVIVGLAFNIYAMIKYNKGIF